jgi:hypothetical protein
MLQHLPADVTCDSYDGLLASLSLSQFGNARVARIVEPKSRELTFNFADVSKHEGLSELRRHGKTGQANDLLLC